MRSDPGQFQSCTYRVAEVRPWPGQGGLKMLGIDSDLQSPFDNAQIDHCLASIAPAIQGNLARLDGKGDVVVISFL